MVVSAASPRTVTVTPSNGRISPLTGILRGGALRDLAALDAGAGLIMSRTDRLRFFIAYTRRRRIGRRDRRAISRILRAEEALKSSERRRVEDAVARSNPSAV